MDPPDVKLRNLLMSMVLALAAMGAVGRVDPHSADASCAMLPSLSRALATAPVIFVGKVVATRNHFMTARVRVQDVWHGTHVPKIAEVDNDSPEDYRLFRKGVVYLFIPEGVSPLSPYQDNACSATRRYSRALAKYRPTNAHRP
jgi:hypothetical protein